VACAPTPETEPPRRAALARDATSVLPMCHGHPRDGGTATAARQGGGGKGLRRHQWKAVAGAGHEDAAGSGRAVRTVTAARRCRRDCHRDSVSATTGSVVG